MDLPARPRLLARGHEVHVVAQGVDGPAARLDVVPHVIGPVHDILRKAAAAEAAVRRLKLDVVHDIGLGWHNHVLQSEDGSRLAQWEQKLLLLPPWQRPWKRAALRLLPRYRDFRRLMARQFGDSQRMVIAVSKMCARDYQRYHNVPERQIRLVYHGTDNGASRPRIGRGGAKRSASGCTSATTRCCCCSWATITAARDCLPRSAPRSGWRPKGRRCGWSSWAAKARAGDSPIFATSGGRLDGAVVKNWTLSEHRVTRRDDPVPYYAAADVFVLPTFYDPCSLSVSEAAASGLPIVTSRFNGAAELLTEGVDGSVIADPGRRRRTGRRDSRRCWTPASADAWARRPGSWP